MTLKGSDQLGEMQCPSKMMPSGSWGYILGKPSGPYFPKLNVECSSLVSALNRQGLRSKVYALTYEATLPLVPHLVRTTPCSVPCWVLKGKGWMRYSSSPQGARLHLGKKDMKLVNYLWSDRAKRGSYTPWCWSTFSKCLHHSMITLGLTKSTKEASVGIVYLWWMCILKPRKDWFR